jgi:hemoglobin-like flavoprotein
MITSQQVKLVQMSWAMVAPISEQAAALFYGRLFELDPSLQGLFRSDLKEQGKKLMQMMGMVVHGLANLESLLPAVKNLGARHVDYGVEDSHYDTVGAALLWTLEQGLGKGFTPEVGEAWAAAYSALATVMKNAAHNAAELAAA